MIKVRWVTNIPDAHLLECAAERRGYRMSCIDSDLYNWLFGVDPAIDGSGDPEEDARIVESMAYEGTA